MGNRKDLGWRRLGLRVQVLILTVAGLAVVFTLLGYLGVRTVEKSTDLVFQERVALARTMAGNVDQSIGFSIDELERMARLYLPSLLSGLASREGLESCLSMCHEKAPLDISRAGMADARGRLIATEPPTAPGSEASLLLAVEEALRRQSSVVQESPDQERVPWGVVVEQEPDVALQQLPAWRQRVLLLSLLFFVLAAITAWFVTGRV